MSENEKPAICHTCGSYCRVVGNITKHYVPFYSDAIKLELDKQNSEIKAQHEELERLRTALSEAVIAERKACLEAIDKHIIKGYLDCGNGTDPNAQRNGMVMAYNIIHNMSGEQKP